MSITSKNQWLNVPNVRSDSARINLLEEYGKIRSAEAEKMNLEEVAEALEKNNIGVPECSGAFNPPQQFLTMFETTIGPYTGAVGYGRPEAAQRNIRGVQPSVHNS